MPTRWSVLLKAPLAGALALALALDAPAMALMHAQHTDADMASMPAAHTRGHHGASGGRHPAPDRPCCDLCATACVSHAAGGAGPLVAGPTDVPSWAPVAPTAAAPARSVPAQLLPLAVGPPARA